ncbi:MAG: DMT family transporter [Mediterranea sp.]|jgi:drug/metabolite transporter (DMT)-like permease|nr:DMT family transporter [Mediterranea sp.]
MKTLTHYLFHIVALCIVAIWGTTFISTKLLIVHGLSPEEIFILRFTIAYAGICIVSHRKWFAHSWRDELWLALAGITGGSLYFWAENTALGITQATNVAFIVCSTPLFTALLSRLFYRNEPTGRYLLLGSLVAVTGMALVVYNGSFVLQLSPLGDALSLCASLAWAFYGFIIRRLSNRYDTLFITRKIFFYGLITILPAFALHPWKVNLSVLMQPLVLGNLLFLGVLASLVCYAVWNLVLKKLGTVRASNYLYLNPLFTLLGATLWLNDRITPMALLGSAAILFGVWLAGRGKKASKPLPLQSVKTSNEPSKNGLISD